MSKREREKRERREDAADLKAARGADGLSQEWQIGTPLEEVARELGIELTVIDKRQAGKK